MTTVSVIIPAYNGDRYIKEAIDSVLAQTYPNYEIIVVDDGSTDNTRSIIQSYGNKINYISQENQGVAAARNRGLKLAQGEYIAFLDQDDFFLPDKLATQLLLLESKSSLSLVNSGWQIVDEEGKVLAAVEPWQKLPILDLAGLIVWKPVFLGAMLFRRSWLEHCGGFDLSWQQTPDVDLVMRLALLGGQADWVKQATVCYRQHQSNASRNAIFQAQELDAMLGQFFGQSDLLPIVKELEHPSRYQSLVWSAWRLYHNGYLAEMANYLAKSLIYSHRYRTQTVLHWIESFKNYAAEYGSQIDVYSLSNSEEWKKLIQKSVFLRNNF
jgi:glycosyltransferase involved in cell wall biosynthesis